MVRAETDPVFAVVVADKIEQAESVPGCITYVQGCNGSPKKRGTFIDPDSATVHTILQQPRSHIVETPGGFTSVFEGVTIAVDPQRLLVESTGHIHVLTRRETQMINPEGVHATKESVARAEPIPPSEIPRQGVTLEEQIDALTGWGRYGKTLQQRFLALLHKAITMKGYVQLEEVVRESTMQRVIYAEFADDSHALMGMIANDFTPGESRGIVLSQDSIELSLDFEIPTKLTTVDGFMKQTGFELSIEGDNALVLDDRAPAGFSHLGFSALELLSAIADSAKLVRLRNDT